LWIPVLNLILPGYVHIPGLFLIFDFSILNFYHEYTDRIRCRFSPAGGGQGPVIGGVKIPHDKGALGHSDADVLLHAICDALLGAACLGDIGVHFPDTSAEFKNIDSKILLAKTYELIRREGYSIVNIDSTLCLEAPKIKPYVGRCSR
jgi:2-C-methyl-D-erythritol 2,4-cyclodiphosphate synthase